MRKWCAFRSQHSNWGAAEFEQQTETFKTILAGFAELAAWLAAAGVTLVGMEATGVYWETVFQALLRGRCVVVAGARLGRNPHIAGVSSHPLVVAAAGGGGGVSGGFLTIPVGDVSSVVLMADDLSQRSVLVLTSLADGPKHGYALIKDIDQFAGVTLGPGTLYGALARLEDAGFVKALPADRRRHPYAITAAGTAALADQLRRDEMITRVGLARLGVQPA